MCGDYIPIAAADSLWAQSGTYTVTRRVEITDNLDISGYVNAQARDELDDG